MAKNKPGTCIDVDATQVAFFREQATKISAFRLARRLSDSELPLVCVVAGVEARGGATVSLSACNVSGSGKSGVFAQAFSRLRLSRCDVVGSRFAGAEAMRCGGLREGARGGGSLVSGMT